MSTILDAPILFVLVNLVHTGHVNLGARTTADNEGPNWAEHGSELFETLRTEVNSGGAVRPCHALG
jgi:hypothetical protein